MHACSPDKKFMAKVPLCVLFQGGCSLLFIIFLNRVQNMACPLDFIKRKELSLQKTLRHFQSKVSHIICRMIIQKSSFISVVIRSDIICYPRLNFIYLFLAFFVRTFLLFLLRLYYVRKISVQQHFRLVSHNKIQSNSETRPIHYK